MDIRQLQMIIAEDGKPMRQPWKWHQCFVLRKFSGCCKENRECSWRLIYIWNRDETHLEALWVVIKELIQVHMRTQEKNIKILKGIGPGKGLYSQGYNLSSSHVRMLELDHKEDWALQNWCFWTVVLEKTLKSLLDYKEMKPVHPKGN